MFLMRNFNKVSHHQNTILPFYYAKIFNLYNENIYEKTCKIILTSKKK